MICSSGVRGASFPRLPVKKAPEFNVIRLRNHLPNSLIPLRRSSSSPSSPSISMRLQSSRQILTSESSDQIRDFFSLQKLKHLVRVIQALIVSLLLRAQSVVFRRRKRKIHCIGETSNDEFILSSPSIPPVVARRDLAIKRILEDTSCDGSSSIRDFSLFKTKRGETLFTQSWTPLDSIEKRGLIVLLHGLNEHSSRYNDFAKQLNLNGFKVYGVDWIGHGGSDGLHAYVPSLDYVVSDLNSFLDKVIAENPGLPCFCIGHSTGGAIILKAMLDPKIESRVSGIVLTSPAIGVRPSHPIVGVIAPVLAFLVPRYQLTAADRKRVVVTRDPEALVAKYSDPLVYTGAVRARTGYEILRVASLLLRNLNRIKIPFLVLHGTSDTVTDPKATQKLYNEASSSDKSIKLFDGFLHDLLFEPERQIVVEVILDWLNRRV